MNTVPSLTKAQQVWGDDAPKWIIELAKACDHASQNKVSKLIGYSGATVSLVLSRTYKGDLKTIEQAVRGAFMKETVLCPVLGELAKHECLANQKKPFSTANSMRISVFKACHNTCPHSQIS